jgi:hypothetical protein
MRLNMTLKNVITKHMNVVSTRTSVISKRKRVKCDFDTYARADWPYNEVGPIPRGRPSSLGTPKAIGGPQQNHLFFFLDQLNLWKFSVWAAAMALYSSIFVLAANLGAP